MVSRIDKGRDANIHLIRCEYASQKCVTLWEKNTELIVGAKRGKVQRMVEVRCSKKFHVRCAIESGLFKN